MSAKLAVPVTEHDHAQGASDAPLTLVEYGDYQCPACGMAYPFVKAVQQRFGDRMRFVFRNFPLSEAHPLASMAAQVAECAATLNRFWEMHDWLYEHQGEWTRLGAPGIVAGLQQLGITEAAVQDALADPAIAERVRADFMGGVRSGVNGTPGFYINGHRFDGGFDTLDTALEAVLGG